MEQEYTVCGSVTLTLPRSYTVTAESQEDAEAMAVELAREQGEVMELGIQVFPPVPDTSNEA